MKAYKDSIVTEKHQAPAGKPGECFWCKRQVGHHHQPTCVVLTRWVVAKITIEAVINVPDSWSKEMIESHRNESSNCANNTYGEIQPREHHCLCQHMNVEVLREANAGDLASRGIEQIEER